MEYKINTMLSNSKSNNAINYSVHSNGIQNLMNPNLVYQTNTLYPTKRKTFIQISSFSIPQIILFFKTTQATQIILTILILLIKQIIHITIQMFIQGFRKFKLPITTQMSVNPRQQKNSNT